MESSDIFSHRIESYSPMDLQFNLAQEDIIRKFYGTVNQRKLQLKPKEAEAGLDHVSNLIDTINKRMKSSSVSDGKGQYCCFSKTNDWVALISIDVQLKGEEEEDDIIRENRPAFGDEYAKKEDSSSLCLSRVIIKITTAKLDIVESISKLTTDLGFKILSDFEVEKGVPITFAFPGPHGPEYHSHSFESIKLDHIFQNYTEEVINKSKSLIQLSRETTHGLVLVNGPVGTGKSYLIRALLSELSHRRGIVCTPPTQFLTQASLLAQVAANFRKSIIVLEDLGEVVSVTSASDYLDARANLLNFTEGFLSLLTDSIIVISFNYELDKIDPAVLRHGRCLSNIKVETLSYERAQSLINFDIPEKKYTLAEIYEMKRINSSDISQIGSKKVGLVK